METALKPFQSSSEMEMITNSMNHYQIIWLIPQPMSHKLKSSFITKKIPTEFSLLFLFVEPTVLMKLMMELIHLP